MAGSDGAGSVHAVMMRVARLAADGTTPAGASNLYVTDTIVKIDLKPVYAEGAEIDEPNGAGISCVTFKADDTLKRYDIGLTVCTPDEELEELLGGGSIITVGGNTVGYQSPAVGAVVMPNGISIEFWTRAIVGGAPAAVNPYRRWALPRCKLRRTDQTIDSGAHKPDFEGQALTNTLWGNGPMNDWTPWASDRIVNRVRTASLPASAIGYQATPVQT